MTAGDNCGASRRDICWRLSTFSTSGSTSVGVASRAPGDVVWPWWVDVTEHAVPGSESTFRYEPHPYEFPAGQPTPEEKQLGQASHNVRSYLILYRTPKAMRPAPSVLVTNVAKDSNAEKAGMKAGDFIAIYDGKPVSTMDELRAALRGAESARVTVVVFRGSERIELELDKGRMGVNLSAP